MEKKELQDLLDKKWDALLEDFKRVYKLNLTNGQLIEQMYDVVKDLFKKANEMKDILDRLNKKEKKLIWIIVIFVKENWKIKIKQFVISALKN